MTIEVAKMHPVQRPGSLKAFCSVVLDGRIAINDVKVLQDGEKAPWVALPSRSYEDREGNTKYAPSVELLDKDLQDEVSAAVLTAWAARSQTAGSPPATEPRGPQDREIRKLIKSKLIDKEDFHQLCREVKFPRPEEATPEQWDKLLQACLRAVEGDSDPFAE